MRPSDQLTGLCQAGLPSSIHIINASPSCSENNFGVGTLTFLGGEGPKTFCIRASQFAMACAITSAAWGRRSWVALMMDVPDLDAFKTAMQSKAASDAMAFDGVVPESLVILVESKG